MNALESLLRICPPPEGPDLGPRGRPAANAGDGPAVPPSHAELVKRYGAGCFDDFLWIYEEECPNEYLDIGQQTREAYDILSQADIPEIRSMLNEFGAVPEELIQWGRTDNADSLFWIPSGAPEDWPTLIVSAGQLDFLLVRSTSPGVVLGLLERSIRCSFVPAEFFDTAPTFERWREELTQED
ncbi:hypothetical protein ABZY57_25905 [Streptomyces sp. NPDC006450]|uniref:hypothetical protein n=1 Tax=Streptomyces sp. NPDC006450 TaxID=3155458 RepID=UPI0033A76AE3